MIRASGKRSRTNSSVPSVEPWSTTIVSRPRSDSRHRSIHGRPLYVTVTAVTSATAGVLEASRRRAAQPFPGQDHRPGERERDRDDEEQESGRERRVRTDPELGQEADEERLPHGEAIDREGHEHDEEEQRPNDVVDA